MRWLLLIFLIVSAFEIGLFIWAGQLIGPWWVVAIIILTGVIGITLAKQQGIVTWNKAIESMKFHQVPTNEIINGVCILVGAVFLFAPGFITDFVGFLLVVPTTRRPFKKGIEKLIRRLIEKSTVVYRKW